MTISQLIYNAFPEIFFSKMFRDFKLYFLNNFFLAEGIEKGNIQNMAGLYWMIGLIGSCILITLSYVSWRKYVGERKKTRSKHKNEQ